MFGFFKRSRKPAIQAPAPPADANKRAAVRVKQRFVEGRIEWPGMLFVRRCFVKDLSAMGACVELTEDDTPASKIPPVVTLQILPDHRKIDAHVVWRNGRMAGLRFTGKYMPTQ